MEWSILGIEATTDKEEITKAYRNVLKRTNPEDDPEGFKRLRGAYDAALMHAEEAQKESSDQKEKTPLDLWADRLSDVYNDFSKRKNPSSWGELFSDETIKSLENHPKAEEILLEFLMDNFNLSQEVWKVIDGEFDLLERKEELYNEFHRDFVDFVIVHGITNKESIPFEYFTPGTNGADCDRFRELYFESRKKEMDDAGLEKILAEIDGLSERHPYGDALIASYYAVKGNEECESGLEEFYRKYPDNEVIRSMYLNTLYSLGKNSECEAACRELIDRRVNDILPYQFLTEMLLADDRKLDAIEVLNEALKIDYMSNSERMMVAYKRATVCEELLESTDISTPSGDSEYNRRMALCCLTCLEIKPDKAKIFMSRIDRNEISSFEYDGIAIAVASAEKDFAAVLQYADKLIGSGDQLKDPKEVEKYNYRLSSWYLEKMRAQYSMGNSKEAAETMKLVLDRFSDDRSVLLSCAQMASELKDHESEKEVAQMLIDGNQAEFDGWYFMADACYELNDDGGTLNAAERLINFVGWKVAGIMFQLKVLLRNGARDQMGDLFYARLNEFRRNGEFEEAEELVKHLYELLEIDLDDSDLFSIYAQAGDWDKARAFLDNRSKEYQYDTKCKAILLELYQGNVEKAKKMYFALNLRYHVAKDRLLDDQFLSIKGDLKGREAFYNRKLKLAKENGSPLNHPYMNLAMIYGLMKKQDKAREYAALMLEENKKLIERSPENAAVYRAENIIGYAILGDHDRAMQEIEEVRELPLCSFCEYGVCKDSYIFEMIMYALDGNYDKAHELAKEGMARWPEELDFLTTEYELRSMGV